MGPRTDAVFKGVALWTALLGFALHLLLWALVQSDLATPPAGLRPLLDSPLLALYTPFSVLLVYEVYQLIQAIPRSFSSAMTKQFEVIALIVVRDALAYLAETGALDQPIGSGWYLLLLAKCVTFLSLLLVTLGFARHEQTYAPGTKTTGTVANYVRIKRVVSILLFLCFVGMATSSLAGWIRDVADGTPARLNAEIFFAGFFTLLIIADITILLISYRFTREFGSLARNTGFVFATILIRLAIEAPGYGAPLLFLLSGVVGFGVLWITSRFEYDQSSTDGDPAGQGPTGLI